MTSLNAPTRSNSSVATNSASGAQLSTENPGVFGLVHKAFGDQAVFEDGAGPANVVVDDVADVS